jgi:CubicO group peptidase (beta-lactamase class C family)
MQFVDQGIIDLDAPVGKYLPEFAGIADDKLTIRHLFNHTSGLQNSGEWASDWNVALENQIAHILPSINIGETFSYHRAGYALAGKVMERISGRAIPYLFQENIFLPLGMKSAYADNTYGGLYCSAIDLARLGQMLLNKGNYNGYKFFSAETFSKMLPIQLVQANRKWGVGTSAMGGNGLSDETFGHSAASGSIFRIDPKNNLIIISARNSEGKSYREFEKSLIENCTAFVKIH